MANEMQCEDCGRLIASRPGSKARATCPYCGGPLAPPSEAAGVSRTTICIGAGVLGALALVGVLAVLLGGKKDELPVASAKPLPRQPEAIETRPALIESKPAVTPPAPPKEVEIKQETPAPAARVATLGVPVRRPDSSTVPFGLSPNRLAVGGGGRWLVGGSAAEAKLAVYDTSRPAGPRVVALPEAKTLFAAGSKGLLVYLPIAKKLRRYSLETLKMEGEQPWAGGAITALAMGHASESPAIARAAGKAALIDPVSLRPIAFTENPVIGANANDSVSVSADGKTYVYGGYVCRHDGKTLQGEFAQGRGYLALSPDGTLHFSQEFRPRRGTVQPLAPYAMRAGGTFVTDHAFVPAAEKGFFASVRFRPGGITPNDKPAEPGPLVLSVFTDRWVPVVRIPFAEPEEFPAVDGGLTVADRVVCLPSAKKVVTVVRDQITVWEVDFVPREGLVADVINPTVWLRPGRTSSATIDLEPTGEYTFTKVSGPAWAEVAAGTVRFRTPAGATGGGEVVFEARDDKGRTALRALAFKVDPKAPVKGPKK